tara:strand:+ start:273 stop:884 length:612 start_codon:yes stop_codon:yes gene_type:complete
MSRNSGRVEIHTDNLWCTPIWRVNLSDNNIHPTKTSLNEDLLNFVIGEVEKNPQIIQKSNRGGWQSRTDLYKEPALEDLKKQIYNVCKSIFPSMQGMYFQQMWAAVNKKDNYNTLHQHGQYMLSGGYYLQVPENSGEISFRDPRPGAISNWIATNIIRQGEWEKYMPKASDMMIWPAFLDHFVLPSQSDQDRIMISFDLNLRF